jgi:hypothetical protein
MSDTKLNSNSSRCTNWSQVIWNAERGMTFYSLPLRLKGTRVWVLSGMRDFSSAHTDDFYRLLSEAQESREQRYLKEHGTKDEPADIGYIIGYRGNPILAVRRNGEILVNERAKSGEPAGARAIARLLPALQSALTARPNLFSL